MKDVVDKVASAELIKRKMAPDFANAMALFYSKKTSERAELQTIRKHFEEKIEKELRNFWWDVYQAYLPNEKGSLLVLPNFEFQGGTRMKAIKNVKSGKKVLIPKLESLVKEYVPSNDSGASAKDTSWKTAKSKYSSEVIYGNQASRPQMCTSTSCTEVVQEVKGETFHDIYITMAKRVFLIDGAADLDFANNELVQFSAECRFMYQKYYKQYSSQQHELYCYVQDIFEACGVQTGLGENETKNHAKLTIEKIEEVVGKMLGHPNTDSQLLVDNVDPSEFCNHLSTEWYKTNYAFSHINFINLKVSNTYGFLMKLGGKFQNKWQDRYFVLDRVLGLLIYWPKPPSHFFEQPAGMIHVSDLQQLEPVELPSPKIFTLLLHPKDKLKKVYQLGTMKEEDLEKWHKDIQKAMREWQDLNLTTEAQTIKSHFRIRQATQYAITQQTECASEMSVKQ
eukprot:Phypoly_transcript_05703.p1 GENE.Phypoly_transcript_05703~~Phypoly_transcript_05703.p1  ORF type:complete len:452 (+),score=79.80 Phypoly_transcript_05703:409-1764(+)